MPKVSVVITCYNYGRYLADAVDSVIRQTYADYEVVLVNDGSTDNTAEVADELVRRYPERVIRVFNQPNEGFPASRNTGIRHSVGEYILPLDADDMLMPEYLAETVRVLDESPHIGFAYTDFRLFGEEEGAQKHNPVDWEYDLDKLLQWCYLLGCNLFRKSAWEKVGGYKDVGYEDWEFWIALADAGYTGKYVYKPLYLWRRHPGSMVADKFSRHDELYLRIRLLHPRLYCPGIAKYSPALARFYLRYRDPVANVLYRKMPRLHGVLSFTKRAVLSVMGKVRP